MERGRFTSQEVITLKDISIKDRRILRTGSSFLMMDPTIEARFNSPHFRGREDLLPVLEWYMKVPG
jgi:hypothetical protein